MSKNPTPSSERNSEHNERPVARQRAPLTDYRYGSHNAVVKTSPQAGDVHPANLSEGGDPAAAVPPHPYNVQFGGKQPDGVERYGMYGMGPLEQVAPVMSEPRPSPGPASLGQYVGDPGNRIEPGSDTQLLEVVDELLARHVDPGVVRTEVRDGDVVLRGTVRDAATREAIERDVLTCLGSRHLRSELEVG